MAAGNGQAHAGSGDAAPGWSPPDGSQQLSLPSLEGLHVRLRPIAPADYGFLQAVELTTDLQFRWRFRGTTPGPEQWSQSLWHGVLAQFLVIPTGKQQPVGLVMAYRANFQDQHAYVGAARLGNSSRSPLVILGFALFIEYVFTCWSFRKLYLETPAYNYEQFASGLDRYFALEGCLRDHINFGGRYWDQLTLAVYRDMWAQRAARVLAAECPRRPRMVRITVPPGVRGAR